MASLSESDLECLIEADLAGLIDADLDGFGPDRFVLYFTTPGIQIPALNPYSLDQDVVFNPKLHSLPSELAPRLPKIDLAQSSVNFLERLSNGLEEGAPSGVYKVHIENTGERLLKIFHGVEKEHKGRSFTREATAYQNLLHGGACAAGVVPHCYGWTIIDPAQWHFPTGCDWLSHFRSDPNPPKALVLEFLPNASRMTLRCVTPERAEDAMNALKTIHQARVQHADIHPRNLLVLPEGRVVWVDFECALSCPWHHAVNQLSLQNELALSWSWLYQTLLPWKWYAFKKSNERGQDEQIDLKALERGLTSRGYMIHV